MSEQHSADRTGHYVTIFLVLVVMTVATIGLSYVHMNPNLRLVAHLAIAVVQASILALYFMHLKEADNLTWLSIAGGLFTLFLLFALTFQDYLTRHFIHY